MALESQAPPANPLKIVVDTIIAPKEAFEAIRVFPAWGWALAISTLLSAIGAALIVPALQHAVVASWPATVAASPQLAHATPEDQQRLLNISKNIMGFAWMFTLVLIPFFCLLQALVMLIFDKLSHGDGNFGKYFSVAANISVPAAGLGSIVNAAVVLLKGSETFVSQESAMRTIPSLGMFIHASGKLGAFLASFTPFSIWGLALTVAAMMIVGRVPKIQAWMTGIVVFLVPALLAVAGTK